jgi:oligogalacturonide transporter
VVSIVMLNYNALQAELTLDYNERTSLSGMRILFSTVASLIGALLPLTIVDAFEDIRKGYIVMGLFFGLFFALPFIFTYYAARERPEFQKPPGKFDWRVAFIEPFKIKTFIYALFMYLFAFVAMDTVSNIVVFFMKYYIKRGDEADFVIGTMLIAQVISIPIYARLSKRSSKRSAFITGALVWFGMMLTSFFLGPDQGVFFIFAFAAVVGLGTGGVIVIMYAIFPDIPDVDELVSGERREGIFSSLVTLIRKMSSALAIFFVGLGIDWAGYVAPIEEIVDGSTKLIEQSQSDDFILVLRLIFALIPILLLAISITFARQYPLSPAIHQRLISVLEVKRGDGSVPDNIDQEVEELKKLLV